MKLVVVDLDGTLLTSNSQLPSEIHTIIDTLVSRNIYIAIASGRQINNIKKLFHNDKLIYIAQNGSCVEVEGQEIFHNTISSGTVNKILTITAQIGLHALLYTKTNLYILSNNHIFTEKLLKYKVQYDELVDLDLMNIANDITKISIMSLKNDIHNYREAFNCIDGINIAVSHKDIIDITSKGINKGSAVQLIQKLLALKSEDTIAFGDQENDIDMFKFAALSYAVENACERIKSQANYIIPSNDNMGVIIKLKEIIDTIKS